MVFTIKRPIPVPFIAFVLAMVPRWNILKIFFNSVLFSPNPWSVIVIFTLSAASFSAFIVIFPPSGEYPHSWAHCHQEDDDDLVSEGLASNAAVFQVLVRPGQQRKIAVIPEVD